MQVHCLIISNAPETATVTSRIIPTRFEEGIDPPALRFSQWYFPVHARMSPRVVRFSAKRTAYACPHLPFPPLSRQHDIPDTHLRTTDGST